MVSDALVHCRVPAATKVALSELARHQGVTASALLKRMVDLAVQSASVASPLSDLAAPAEAGAQLSRIAVRLRVDDCQLLRERARARGMPAATYISSLVRSHLRSLAPLPKDEYVALRRTLAELSRIGRNLNQVARASNQGDRAAGPDREAVKAMLRVAEGIRHHVAALLKANLRSWDVGHG